MIQFVKLDKVILLGNEVELKSQPSNALKLCQDCFSLPLMKNLNHHMSYVSKLVASQNFKTKLKPSLFCLFSKIMTVASGGEAQQLRAGCYSAHICQKYGFLSLFRANFSLFSYHEQSICMNTAILMCVCSMSNSRAVLYADFVNLYAEFRIHEIHAILEISCI